MLRKWLRLMGIVGVLALWFSNGESAKPVCPDQIRMAYADTELPPYLLGGGTSFQDPPGLFVVWARTAIERLGCKHVVREVRLPYHRIVTSMADGVVDMRVTGGFRTDVLSAMRYPMRDGKPDASLAVAAAETKLYVAKGAKPLQWDGKALHKGDALAVVGTVRGHFSETVLQARNWPIDTSPSWSSNVAKLFAGRVDAIAGSDSVIDALPERHELTTLEPPVQFDLFFVPVSHQFYERNSEFINNFWFEMCVESRATFKTLPACKRPQF